MRETVLTVAENERLTANVFRLTLAGKGLDAHRPGQFVNLKLDGLFLRRPISVFDQEGDVLRLIFRAVGKGTGMMAEMRPGDRLDALTGLGNGYDMEKAGDRPLLIGGGVGIPPLYLLAKELIRRGKAPEAVLGFNTREDMFSADEFRALGCRVTVATADGSEGVRGFVTDAMPGEPGYVFARGPEPMLKAVWRRASAGGQFSFEERMGCGFGACMGCSCRTAKGYKRICRDGPVLEKEEILWDD